MTWALCMIFSYLQASILSITTHYCNRALYFYFCPQIETKVSHQVWFLSQFVGLPERIPFVEYCSYLRLIGLKIIMNSLVRVFNLKRISENWALQTIVLLQWIFFRMFSKTKLTLFFLHENTHWIPIPMLTRCIHTFYKVIIRIWFKHFTTKIFR